METAYAYGSKYQFILITGGPVLKYLGWVFLYIYIYFFVIILLWLSCKLWMWSYVAKKAALFFVSFILFFLLYTLLLLYSIPPCSACCSYMFYYSSFSFPFSYFTQTLHASRCRCFACILISLCNFHVLLLAPTIFIVRHLLNEASKWTLVCVFFTAPSLWNALECGSCTAGFTAHPRPPWTLSAAHWPPCQSPWPPSIFTPSCSSWNLHSWSVQHSRLTQTSRAQCLLFPDKLCWEKNLINWKKNAFISIWVLC